MKILITKTSDCDYSKFKEYDSLEQCVEECLDSNAYHDGDDHEVIVARPKDLKYLYKNVKCDYIVEIYNGWRE